MNCTQALQRLLEADLEAERDAARPMADREFEEHLAGCARCARAASALRVGTVALARAVASERAGVSRPVVERGWSGGFVTRLLPRFALAGAAIAVILFVVSRSDGIDPTVTVTTGARSAALPTESPTSPPTASGRPTPSERSSPGRTTRAVAPREPAAFEALPVDPVAFVAEPVRLAAVEATPFIVTNSADLPASTPTNHADAARVPEITVTNRLGTHATVSRTTDPNIVVIWLSAEPNRRNP